MSNYPPNTIVRRGNYQYAVYLADPRCARCKEPLWVAVTVVVDGRTEAWCMPCSARIGSAEP